MVVKPLLVEHLAAVLALDPWSGGVALALVVGQARLSQSLDRATSVVTALHQDAVLDVTSSHLGHSSLCLVHAC